jgi:hypothetical protein
MNQETGHNIDNIRFSKNTYNSRNEVVGIKIHLNTN